MNRPRRYQVAAGVVVLVGGGLILATIVWKWGHLAYGLGVAAVAAGVAWAVAMMVRGKAWKVGLSAVAALVIGAGAVVTVAGLPQSPPRWEDPDAEGPNSWSARTGDLIITAGTARNIKTGEVASKQEGPDARPMLVDAGVVVIGTDDGSIGVDPATGREIWRSAVGGRGLAHDGDILVVASPVSGDRTEAVALDLATGETLWQQVGRPVMECDLGPADRFSPAREQSHVLFVRDEERERSAELLDLADGHPTIVDVDCSLNARIVGEVLLEADGPDLTGRSLTDGESLWSTPVDEPWNVHGGGSTVFTPTGGAALTAIDVTIGQSTRIDPPPGTEELWLPKEEQRAPEAWAMLDPDSELSLWNPGTDAIVAIPDAASVRINGVDVSSGWMALSGTTRDLTGEESNRCWALSQDGQLSAAIPGICFQVADGLLETQSGVYPI